MTSASSSDILSNVTWSGKRAGIRQGHAEDDGFEQEQDEYWRYEYWRSKFQSFFLENLKYSQNFPSLILPLMLMHRIKNLDVKTFSKRLEDMT